MGESTRRSFVRTTGLTALALGASRALSGVTFAQSAADTAARVVVDPRRVVATIDRRLFGSFLEHLGQW